MPRNAARRRRRSSSGRRRRLASSSEVLAEIRSISRFSTRALLPQAHRHASSPPGHQILHKTRASCRSIRDHKCSTVAASVGNKAEEMAQRRQFLKSRCRYSWIDVFDTQWHLHQSWCRCAWERIGWLSSLEKAGQAITKGMVRQAHRVLGVVCPAPTSQPFALGKSSDSGNGRSSADNASPGQLS